MKPFAEQKVLVAVSAPDMAEAICHFLFEGGAQVAVVASSMFEAADLMLSQDYNLFVVHGDLPYAPAGATQVAGADFVRFIRLCDGAAANASVLFLCGKEPTAGEITPETADAHSAGADAIVAAPFDLLQFEMTIKTLPCAQPMPVTAAKGMVNTLSVDTLEQATGVEGARKHTARH